MSAPNDPTAPRAGGASRNAGSWRRAGGSRAAGVGLIVALASTVAAPTAVASHGGPSAGAVAQSRHLVATREHQVAVAAGRIAAARAQARTLGEAADAASEAYDGAQVKLHIAQRDVNTAQLVLAGADRRVAVAQAAVARFAAAAYESGGMSPLSALLSNDGTAHLISRVGAITAISLSQRDTLQQLHAAQVYQAVVRRQAQAVQAQAQAAVTASARARADAQAAVARQSAVLSGLRGEQQRLQTLLADARAHATALQRARLRAILRARAIAARRAAAARVVTAAPAPASANGSGTAAPYAAVSGSTAGTVSAGTAASAVHEAESQIGKPYQWGAAGPNTYDCSGLVMWAYDQVGVHLDHWTGDQWNEGAHVSRGALRPGDLVFFAYDTSDPSTIHHVGMYIGNGEMVEAPYTGANVRISGAYRPDYIGAVRPYQR